MSQSLRIAFLVLVCSCSTNGPDPVPPEGPAPDGSAAAPEPDTTSLPASQRLHPEPVDSVADVPGSYVQPYALPGDISLITLGATNWGMGDYQLFRSCGLPTCVAETGQYDVIATNPAIGFAALSLVDATGTVRTTYVLDQLWRDSHGALVAIQLRPLLANAPGPTQLWWRLPAGTTAPSASSRLAANEPIAEPTRATALAAANSHAAIAGVFIRALPIYGDIDALTFANEAWTSNTAAGSYTAAYPYCLPWCFGETGGYELDLANAATGTGHLTLVPEGNPEAAHDYAVYAIWRAPDNTAAAIQLQRFDGVIASGPPFTLYRQWWPVVAEAQSGNTMCSTWTALAGYYRSQALLCGMSACWTLAPWYSAWAQYYDGLATAAGCYGS